MPSVNYTARRFWLCINFAFVTWGVLFLLGLFHGIFRSALGSRSSMRIIFGAAGILHLIALSLLLAAVCYGLAYFVRRVKANARARRRIEQLSAGGDAPSKGERREIYAEEYESDPKPGSAEALPA